MDNYGKISDWLLGEFSSYIDTDVEKSDDEELVIGR